MHKITTITDLLDVATPENIDRLFADLRHFLIETKGIREAHKELGWNDITDTFVWTDDGEIGCIGIEYEFKPNE